MLPDELLRDPNWSEIEYVSPPAKDVSSVLKNESELDVMRKAAEKVTTIVTGERNKCYGTPSENHSVTGEMWGAYLTRKLGVEVKVSGSDVCWLNILQKASRQAHWPQEDNGLDVAGYALNSLACEYAEGIQDG